MKKIVLISLFLVLSVVNAQAQLEVDGIDKSSPKLQEYSLDAATPKLQEYSLDKSTPKLQEGGIDFLETEPILRTFDAKSGAEVVFYELKNVLILSVDGHVVGAFEPVCLDCEEIKVTY